MPSDIPLDAYVIIIGAMKSGTTFLFELLSHHPKICPCITKEPNFFSHYSGPEVEEYEELFDFDPDTHVRCLEASAGYTRFPIVKSVPKRMKEYGIDPWFIHSVRNPFKRIESEYNFAHLGHKSWANDDILNKLAINGCRYNLQLSEFMKYYTNRDRYYIVDFDDISKRPSKLAQEIFDWLGIGKAKIDPPGPVGVTPSPSKIEEKIKRKLLASSLPWRRILPSKFVKLIQRLFRKYDSPAKRRLAKEEKKKLQRILQDDMQQFGENFDFPVEKWGF